VYVNDPAEIESMIWNALYAESSLYQKPEYFGDNIRSCGCFITGCKSRAYAKGMCNAHYIRARNGKGMLLPVRNRKRGVSCLDCGKETTSKGGWMRCPKHFKSRRGRVVKAALVCALGGKCVKCGGTFPLSVYDFHHVYTNKDGSPGDLICSASVEKIAAELSKCVLICANCHRIEHNE